MSYRDETTEMLGYILAFSIFIICLICVIGLAGACQQETHERMDENARAKAFCESVGGKYGGEVCYKDGKEITDESKD